MVPPGAQHDVSSPPSDRVGEDEAPERADISSESASIRVSREGDVRETPEPHR